MIFRSAPIPFHHLLSRGIESVQLEETSVPFLLVQKADGTDRKSPQNTQVRAMLPKQVVQPQTPFPHLHSRGNDPISQGHIAEMLKLKELVHKSRKVCKADARISSGITMSLHQPADDTGGGGLSKAGDSMVRKCVGFLNTAAESCHQVSQCLPSTQLFPVIRALRVTL